MKNKVLFVEDEADLTRIVADTIGTLIELLADSIDSGVRDNRLATFRDSAIASEFAWNCLRDAADHDMPVRGTTEELRQIHTRRKNMTEGYGLLHKPSSPLQVERI